MRNKQWNRWLAKQTRTSTEPLSLRVKIGEDTFEAHSEARYVAEWFDGFRDLRQIVWTPVPYVLIREESKP